MDIVYHLNSHQSPKNIVGLFEYCLDGEPIARGCASKEKMFHEQCEVHEMDEISEKFCYCSFNWCNSSHHLTVKIFSC